MPRSQNLKKWNQIRKPKWGKQNKTKNNENSNIGKSSLKWPEAHVSADYDHPPQ